MNKAVQKKFLDIIRREKPFVGERDLDRLNKKFGENPPEFAEALITENLLKHREVCRMLSTAVGKAYVDPFSSVVTNEALEKIPANIARKAQALPLYHIEDTITISMADPLDEAMIRRLEGITGMKVSPVFSLGSEVRDAVEVYYSTEEDIQSILQELAQTGEALLTEFSANDVQALSESKGLIQIVDAIIYFALRERASDIHIEPHQEETVIRFRIDGRLREMLRFSKAIHRALLVRIKILCDMNIAESRFPHDGRMTIPLGARKADFRVSVIPTVEGEKCVIRVLASTSKREMMTLDRMMISQAIQKPLRRVIQNPNGIIFVTGPTGSGKTTTLYAALNEINKPDINISTIEDPVEIRLAGVTQAQVNNHIDLKFSTLLRSMLRQDPDVLLVGEIRDLETAKIACEAALTGHLVFATLHTNNSIQAVTRLIEIGIEPYMVAPAILAVLAQRLAARICERCKEAYYPTEEVLSRYFHDADGVTDVPFYLGKGCNACRGSGYHGRVAFHEMALITEEMRNLIARNAGLADLTAAARKAGYKPLRYDGLKKVLLGFTTPEEIEKHTSFEWSM